MVTATVLTNLPYHFLRFFFNYLYNQFAWMYDFVAWVVSSGHWNEWVLAVLPYLDGPIILEIGHGPGHLLHAMAMKHWQVFGIDRSQAMIRLARDRCQDDSNIHMVNGDAQKLCFSDNSFNQVIATFPSDYIFIPSTLNEIFRTLQPEGKLIVLLYANTSGISLVNAVNNHSKWSTVQPDTNGMVEKIAELFNKTGFHFDFQQISLPSGEIGLIFATKTTKAEYSSANCVW